MGELVYNFFRYYDPKLGRYITNDPINLFGGINTFLYALGNPLILSDRYGLRPTCTPSPKMKACLEKVLGGPIDDVSVTEDPGFVDMHGAHATTREESIYVKSCQDFWNNLDMVLHEYYHVVHQWRTGQLTREEYLKEYFELLKKYNGNKHKAYWNISFEKDARKWAKANLKKLQDCVKNSCPDGPSRYTTGDDWDDGSIL